MTSCQPSYFSYVLLLILFSFFLYFYFLFTISLSSHLYDFVLFLLDFSNLATLIILILLPIQHLSNFCIKPDKHCFSFFLSIYNLYTLICSYILMSLTFLQLKYNTSMVQVSTLWYFFFWFLNVLLNFLIYIYIYTHLFLSLYTFSSGWKPGLFTKTFLVPQWYLYQKNKD